MKIKNWHKFQHFKDRRPPWIKLYRDLLDDPDWHELDGDCVKLLVNLWMLASEDKTHQGILPDFRKILFRLRLKENELKQGLTKLSHWLDQDDITMISEQYQIGPPETEGETETQVETERERSSLRSDVSHETFDWPLDYREQFWNKYPRKKAKKAAFKILERLRKSNEITFEKLMVAVGKIPIGEPTFIPHPATWLNQGRWDDEQLPGEQNGAFTGNITPAIDGLIERVRDFDRPPDIRGTTGKTAVRMLSEGGREQPGDIHGGGDGDLGRISEGSDPLRH